MAEEVKTENTEIPENNNELNYVEQTKSVDLCKREIYNSRITQTKLHLLELQNEIKNNFDNPIIKAIIENEINITEAYYHVLNLKVMIIDK